MFKHVCLLQRLVALVASFVSADRTAGFSASDMFLI